MGAVATISDAAIGVLKTASPDEKYALSRRYARLWARGGLRHAFGESPPDRPARPAQPALLLPKDMPRRRPGAGPEAMVALLHAVAHIEFNAIDLAWDIVARFGGHMPVAFTDDWVSIADDEARHFHLITARLCDFNASYGDRPAHDGLWQSAMDTAHDLKARLALVPMVLEARGLDVTPAMIDRLEKARDHRSAEILRVIYEEEIGHVHAGQKWFKYICHKEKIDPRQTYQNLVRQYFKGKLKPPFNMEARTRAGLEKEFYLPLATS